MTQKGPTASVWVMPLLGRNVLVSRDLVEVDQALEMLGELLKVLLPEVRQKSVAVVLVLKASRYMQLLILYRALPSFT